MGFFNKKEEVINIELTPYGRYLLSIGKLMPHHYKFFDDNIVYDIAAHGSGSTYPTERQNESHVRIIEETPRLKQNPNVTGVETYINLLEEVEDPARATTTPDLPNTRDLQRDDNINQLQQEIGTNSYTTDKKASFNASIYNSEIKTASRYLVSNNTQNLNISQIDIDLNYEFRKKIQAAPSIFPEAAQVEELTNMQEGKEPYVSLTFEDKTYFEVTPKVPIVYLREQNSFDEKENFDIVAYSVEVDSNGKELYTQFRITEKLQRIVNDMLVDTSYEAPAGAPNMDLDERHLEYFLNIGYDREIPDIDICKALGSLEVENIFLNEYIDCEDILNQEADANFNIASIYDSSVSPSDLEDCDDDV